MNNIQATQGSNAVTPANQMKTLTSNSQIQEMFKNSLGENSGAFLSCLIELYSDPAGTLKECDANAVIMEALKAATLKLPINKNLGFAWILPYKKKQRIGNQWTETSIPQFQIGYKGLIQLAIRTGQYKTMNANVVYEGMEVEEDYLTGEIKIKGKPTSDKVVGYFAYFRLINGYEKTLYWSAEKLEQHATKFSKSFAYRNKPGNVWNDNYEEMALKTLTKRILSKYGVLSTEMQKAEMLEADYYVEEQKELNANKEPLQIENVDMETGEVIEIQGELTEEEKEEIIKQEEQATKAPF